MYHSHLDRWIDQDIFDCVNKKEKKKPFNRWTCTFKSSTSNSSAVTRNPSAGESKLHEDFPRLENKSCSLALLLQRLYAFYYSMTWDPHLITAAHEPCSDVAPGRRALASCQLPGWVLSYCWCMAPPHLPPPPTWTLLLPAFSLFDEIHIKFACAEDRFT